MIFWGFDPTIVILIPAMILAFIAQSRVNSAYRRYAAVRNRRGVTGQEAARRILDSQGLSQVQIEVSRGTLSDHYDPRRRVVKLSNKVFNEPSIASISIAAHEVGHAMQHAKGYAPLKIRNAIVPVVNIVSNLCWPLLILGIVLAGTSYYVQADWLFNIGVFSFAAVVIFHLITLPVELNASKRALAELEGLGIVYQEEAVGAKKMLSAAAMTYVAALAMAVANLLRILMIRGRN